jgi:hypothetical protein
MAKDFEEKLDKDSGLLTQDVTILQLEHALW